eukprot:m.25363 g.25363  ORF g.25363 m.25363 type:complete len:403 (+) comp8698_c0_seq1:158-1366(+)
MSTKPTQRETQRKVALEELIASARFLIARNQPNDWDAGVALLREVVKEDEGYQPFLQFILDQGKPPVPGEQREEAEPSGFWPQTQRYASQAWTKAVFYFWVVVVFLVNKTPLQSMFGLLEQPEATDTNASSSSSQQGRSQGANSQRKQKGMEFDGPRAAGDPLSFSAKDLPTEAILIPTGSKEAVNRILHVNERDLYRILCVPATATAAELKRAYRLQSLRLHPDKNTHPKAEAAFKRLNYAYDILSDQAARSNYHAEIQAQMSMSDFESAVKSQTEEFVKSMKQKAAKVCYLPLKPYTCVFCCVTSTLSRFITLHRCTFLHDDHACVWLFVYVILCVCMWCRFQTKFLATSAKGITTASLHPDNRLGLAFVTHTTLITMQRKEMYGLSRTSLGTIANSMHV